jgi:hypothetical protein
MPGLVSSHRRQPSQGGAAAVVILGDASSAGYLSDDNGERAFVEAAARGVGMSVLAGEQRRSARVHGYCEALGCKAYRGKGAPEGWERVSDHCPVTIEVGR